LSARAAKKKIAKTIKANIIFGSITITPLIIPSIFSQAVDTESWGFMTPPKLFKTLFILMESQIGELYPRLVAC
jgi:hypothetical protein